MASSASEMIPINWSFYIIANVKRRFEKMCPANGKPQKEEANEEAH